MREFMRGDSPKGAITEQTGDWQVEHDLRLTVTGPRRQATAGLIDRRAESRGFPFSRRTNTGQEGADRLSIVGRDSTENRSENVSKANRTRLDP
jgi:hypothetical protein